MADYISREALLERIDDIWDCADMVFEPNDKCCRADDCASCKWAETKRAIRKIVEYFPVADVREVKRGEWYGEADGYADGGLVYDMWSCPCCGQRFDEWDEKPDWNFCPNCGADMRSLQNANNLKEMEEQNG